MTLLQDTKPYTLGLDIGVNSVGWALVTANDGTPYSILKAGVRIFPEGVEKGIERGMEKPKNAKRRDFRQRTKQLRRRAKRHIETALALQRAGLLPLGNISTSSARQTFFQGLDSRLFTDQDRKIYPHQLLYRLRARALDEKLLPEAVGRALHHLAQRRGFLSNRRTEKKKEDSGIVHEAINDLAQKMAGAKARTLGEYFSKLDPEEERIRSRWTARGMFQHEFDAIWSAQSAHHPVLMTDQAKKDVYRTIFDQRRLKKQKHLIGECSLEKGHIRAPVALLISQRFRMLQKINDLEASSKISGEIFDLTEKRSVLIDLLEKQGDMTFDKVKKALGLGTDAKLNFEKEDEKNEKLPGNRTSAKLRKVFGERWDELSEEEKNLVVNDVLCFRRDDKLAERGERRWGLAPKGRCRSFCLRWKRACPTPP
jgi:CRISPR-associated endonuclease Csn1